MGPAASLDVLGNLDPNCVGRFFPPVVTEVPDLDAILHDVPETTWLQIQKALKTKWDKENCNI